MILGAQPLKTFAILVGVETYEGNDKWELNGPAMNAMRMALWLISRGVPSAHIQLFVNFSTSPALQTSQGLARREALRLELEVKGLVPRRPDRAALERVLDPDYLPAAELSSATLIVYISGHGLHAIGDNSRYALTADASRSSCHAIDVENQANNLRLNKAAARFNTQWIIHDACAQTTSAALQPKIVVCPVPADHGNTRQYCLFAAQPGEFALTDADKGGAFTDCMLSILEKGVMPLPDLDIEALYRNLEGHFRKTRQHPALYRRNEHLTPNSLAPGMSHSDAKAVDELAEALRSVPIGASIMRAAFGDVARERAPAWVGQRQKDQWQGVRDAIADLDARLPETDTGLTPVELFALRLASYCARHVAADVALYSSATTKLNDWIEAWPATRASAATTLERKRLQKIERDAAMARIVVLEPAVASMFDSSIVENGRPARAWLYAGQEQPQVHWFEPIPGTLNEKIAGMLAELARECWIIGTTTVELMLPLDALFQHFSGIDVMLDEQRGIAVALGSRKLLLALRASERSVDQVWNEQWLDHWTAGTDGRRGMATVALVDTDQDPAAETWCWLGTSAPIQPGTLKKLTLALYYGAPFAAWWDSAHQAVVDQTLTSHSYADVMPLLHNVAELNSREHPFTCLIDDPARTPFDQPLEQPF